MALEIPGLASFILTHEWDGELQGLNDFVAEDGTVLHPPVAPVFWSFRVMVGTRFSHAAAQLGLVWFPCGVAARCNEGRIEGHWFASRGCPSRSSGRSCPWPSPAGSHARGLVHHREKSAASPGWCRA